MNKNIKLLKLKRFILSVILCDKRKGRQKEKINRKEIDPGY
jgi:hypothetical protein